MKKMTILAALLMVGFSSLAWADKVVTKYYSDGSVLLRKVYYDNGAHKGPDRFYWPNGRLRMKILYQGGQRSKVLRWTDDGQAVT